MSQDPPAGDRAAAPRVDLLISEGDPPAAYVMPALVGMNELDAEKVLDSAGLHMAQISYTATGQAARGTVARQSPGAGTRIEADVAVSLTVTE